MAVNIGKNFGYLKDGFALVKPNIVSWIIALIPTIIPGLGVHYLAAVKEAKASGKAPGFGDVLKFDNIVNHIIAIIGVMLGGCCCTIGYGIFPWAWPLQADHPGLGGPDALKASLAHGKKNFVANWVCMVCIALPMIVVCIGISVVVTILSMVIGSLASLLSLAIPLFMVIYMPIFYAALWLAYEDNKADIHAAAAEAQITLA